MLKVFGTRGRNKHSWRGVSFGDTRTVPMGAGVVATFGLVVLTLGLLWGVGVVDSQPTHATTNDDTTISITPASGINLNMTPTAGTQGSFGTATANVTVTTTGAAGYTFTMNTETTSTDLKSERVDYTDPTKADMKITNITASTTQANFSPNKWGYNVNKSGTYIKGAANTYIPVPNSGSSDADRQIEITDAAGSNTYTFTYGVKANNNLPAGEYATTLVFSATANAIPLISMQEATYANCGENMYDNRSTDAYKEIEYTTAEINGLCWMTRNLDLPGGTKLSHADTNVPEGYSTTTAGFTNGDALPASSTSGFSSNATAYVYNSNSTTCGDNSPCYSYYSYAAATAGYNPSSGASNYDICPSGWRLPTEAELTTLKNSYSTGTALTGSPFLGVYAGYYNYSQFYTGGSYGRYWSSTAYDSNRAYRLRFSSSSADVNLNDKGYGNSVRCVMKPTMQAATQASLAAAMPNDGDTTTLTDSRDGQDYSIAKINNQYWMTKNLNLAGGTKLSHADTNVPEGYSTSTSGFTNGDTLPASSTSGFSDTATAYVYNSNSTTCGNNSPCYSYYSWRAATAGYNSTSSSTPVNYDICPSGWRLPTSAELTTLRNSYSTGTALTGSPFLGIYAGYYNDSQFYNGGSYGRYWSSTAYNSFVAYGLSFYSSSAYVDYYGENYGYSVRCVAQS